MPDHSATKEHPILFSAPMVRAILEGRKTITRRVVKPRPSSGAHWQPIVLSGHGGFVDGHGAPLRCPYGQPGDRLWVRETFQVVGYGGFGQSTERGYESFETIGVEFAAGGDPSTFDFLNGKPVEGTPKTVDYAMANRMSDSGPEGNRPSIHMPRWASRITLEVTGVRVERLQDISDADAISEGVERWVVGDNGWRDYMLTPEEESVAGVPPMTAKQSFQTLWKSINGASSWNNNPWVWVVEFKRVTP